MWWQMVEWFDEAVIWMKLWQTKTVQFWPEKWYGEYDDSLVITYSENEVWDLSQFIEWETIYLWMWYPAKIVKVTDKNVTFDFNSELAGKDLIFDITVKAIN
jgi:FKBP-type peptidyl-prolyl cis-trans isomerase 2